MTTTIEIFDPQDGVPTRARCSVCWEEWHRPADDPRADSLVDFAVRHRVRHDEAEP